MSNPEQDPVSSPRRRVLIPLDAQEALQALSRFAYSAQRAPEEGSSAPPSVGQQDAH